MSDFAQNSFNGGMNLLDDDIRLKKNEYRLALNLRSRFGGLRPVPSGVEDTAAPVGVKQEIGTFGNYVFIFVAGYCYYRLYSATGWKKVDGFKMSTIAPRFWTAIVPITTILQLRKATSDSDVKGGSTLDQTGVAAIAGNVSGIVVQDNISQPWFIYVDPSTLLPVARVLQTYTQWDNTTNKREYVPIGNSMAWVDGILFVVSQDFNTIYRSVEGRPLDFVVIIKTDGSRSADATFSSYSVGIGGITCIRPLSSNALLVTAGISNFAVSKNLTINAITICGEYTFIRNFLFNATCLSDRVIIDSLGDTKFIDYTGMRSFNAVEYLQNEGRNSPYSLKIQELFEGQIQEVSSTAGMLYDNYEFWAINSSIGKGIAVYDTLTESWSSFDTNQVNGSGIKMFAKIDLTIQRLYAITTDDKLYTLYTGTDYAPLLRTLSISPVTLMQDGLIIPPSYEHKIQTFKCIFQYVTEDFVVRITPFVQNELTLAGTLPKTITYNQPNIEYDGPGKLSDVNTNVKTAFWTITNCAQGSQSYMLISWTSAAQLLQFEFTVNDIASANPLRSQ